MKPLAAQVASLLFGSGTCALIYQVVWLREMRLVFGGSTAASAAVLAIFMGGLGLGSALLGRRADRHPHPLQLYAKLELAIALSAALTPVLVLLARAAYIALGGSVVLGLAGATVVRLLLAALVLCVPTFLMGGTLPAAAKAVETEDDVSRRRLALLYGVNTLGAVTGAFVSTFFLLEAFGARMTLWLACLVNLSVAGVAYSLGARPMTTAEPASAPSTSLSWAGFAEGSAGLEAERGRAAPAAHNPTPGTVHRPSNPAEEHRETLSMTPVARPTTPAARHVRRFALIAAGVVGFAFLLMELVWYRMMAPILGGTSFTFGLILAVALFGIGLGGAAYAAFGSTRPATIGGFALTCVLEAACIAYPFALGDQIAFLALALRSLDQLGFYGLVLGWTLVTAVVILPAAVVAGVQFPLLINLLGKGSDNVGHDTGMAYAWNTLGAIAGSLAGGFGLLPLLSAPGTWRAVVVLLVGLGVAAVILKPVAQRRSALQLAMGGAALALLFATGPTAVWRHSGIGAGRADLSGATSNNVHYWTNERRRAIRWEVDGIESSVALEALDGYDFVVNGKVDGNSRSDAPTQVMSGLIAGILHPDPRRVLVVGLGTGSTAGWLGAVPSVERVDVVELEPTMLRVAKACAAVNHNVLDNPKVHVFIGDGREVLLTTPYQYDVIVSEPSNPYRAGVASLFTVEFYRAAAARLADGGLFAQWMQTYEVDTPTVRSAYATLTAVFPSVETWETLSNDILLVSSLEPVVYDVDALRARARQEPFKRALASVWHAADLEGLLSRYLANPDFARAVAGQPEAIVNTDDLNVMEFGFARNVGGGTVGLWQLRHLARARKENVPAMTGDSVDWENVTDQYINMYTAGGATYDVAAGLSEEQQFRALAQNLYVQGDYDDAVAAWRQQSREPAGPLQLAVIGESLAEAGEEESIKYIDQLREFQPVEADALLARLRWRQELREEAVASLEASFTGFQHDPWPMTGLMTRTLNLVLEIAAQDPALGLRLYDVLKTPMASAAIETSRLMLRRHLATLDLEKLCGEAWAPYEPYPPWQGDALAERLHCYQAAGNPEAAQAQRDLDEFASAEPVPFGRGLEVADAPPADDASSTADASPPGDVSAQ